MKIIGIDAVRGERVIVEFGSVIQGVTELIDLISGEPDYVAPGFIDLQVNGYGGVDYNSWVRGPFGSRGRVGGPTGP